MSEPKISEELNSVSLYKLDDGLFYIQTPRSDNFPICNLKQAMSHLYYLGVVEDEIFRGIEWLENNGHNFCSFGMFFGSFLFSDLKKFHIKNGRIVISDNKV